MTKMIPGGIPMPSFVVYSQDTLICPEITNPTYMPTLTIIGATPFFEINHANHSVKNISNRTFQPIGNMSVSCEQTGSNDATLNIISERSMDGIIWEANSFSLRQISIEKTGIDLITVPSYATDGWKPNEEIRFLFSKEGNGGITIQSGSETINGYEIDRFSFYWAMIAR